MSAGDTPTGSGLVDDDRTPSPRVDVCVVGAGPAGALVASKLAAAGHEVIVLDAGPQFDPNDRQARMERHLRPGLDAPVWDVDGERDAYSSSGEQYYPLNVSRVKGIGGSTLHWQGMVMRMHEQDFRLASDTGMGDDWPIAYDDLKSYYASAEAELSVSGASDNPFAPPRDDPHPLPAFPPSYSDSLFAEACEAVGLATHSVPNARNSEPTEEASACVGYGTCKPVCPSGAKYDATRHIERAAANGARILDRVPVQRLEHDDAGEQVTTAVYATPDGEEHRQEAREFVVAAGGVETPRLLLLSQSETYPDGLANSSGLVGRYFMDHLFAGMGGTLDEPTRQKHVGFNTTESHQFYDRPDDSRTAIKLEFLNYAGPAPADVALGADTFGDELLEEIRGAYGTHVAMGALVEQLPRRENRIRLDPSRTDDHGNPVPDVVWGLDAKTRATIERANEIQRDVLEEMGVDIGWTVGPDNTGPAYHHMGTTRMGTDPTDSVVDPQLRTHDLGNLTLAGSSVFVTGGAMNPTLTIAALSLKAADHVAERL
ncbi:GMC family oxidoreductase [Halobaculum limi]|uniref:GMC family oxidoreductase n=1 Tax=Halobaculum limi TaxID=3031916 RepID=UPI002406517D|nr:GMC family oxidoreductase [Halobaculum sp. YSMS11]